MQLPYRKPGKYSQAPFDPYLTQEKYDELSRKLERLFQKRPLAAQEVGRLAELGDFSENVEYQLAKGRLRRINEQILILENQLKQAKVIRTDHSSPFVELGDTLEVVVNGTTKTLTILGSSETDPTRGIISQHSPIGTALLGKRIGETVAIPIGKRTVTYTITSKKRL